VSYGPLTRTGTLRSNGVEFVTSGATVTIDGNSASLSDLRSGQVAAITADLPVNGTANARVIAVEHAVIGVLLAQSRIIAGQIKVMDQLVIVDGMTTYEGFDAPNPTAADIPGGAVVAVTGVRYTEGVDASQTSLYATRITRRSQATPYMVRGSIRNLDTTRREFDLTLLKVRYDSANSVTGTLANDECVLARGTTLTAGNPLSVGVFVPASVEVVPCVPEADIGDRILLEGRSTPIRGTSSLGAVALNEVATYFPGDVATTGGAPADLLVPGLHVLAEGAVNADGDLRADRFTIYGLQEAQVRLRGLATVNGQSLSVFGVPVELDGTTRYEDTAPQPLSSYGPADLRTGDLVEVRGYQPRSNNTVRARIVERRTSGEPFELRGFPLNVVRPTFAILGVTVTTTPATVWYSDFGFITGPDMLFTSPPNPAGDSRRVRAVCAAPCNGFQPQRVHLVERNSGW
jgi:hypothetical protein